MMAHSRSIALFHKVLGPIFNLSALWEMHCYYEFATRDVDATMATMVAQPYVNHVPTMTGGVGYKELHRFYQHHFVNSNPADTRLIPISRTIGADRVVDEMIFCFTHDREIDWMLPGVKPTGKYVEVPLSRSSISAATSSITSTSIGIRPRCWCRWGCSMPSSSLPPGARPRRRCSTRTCPPTR